LAFILDKSRLLIKLWLSVSDSKSAASFVMFKSESSRSFSSPLIELNYPNTNAETETITRDTSNKIMIVFIGISHPSVSVLAPAILGW